MSRSPPLPRSPVIENNMSILKTMTPLSKPKYDNRNNNKSDSRLDYLVYSPEEPKNNMRQSSHGHISNAHHISMYSPPMSRGTSPSGPHAGLSPLESLSIAQLSALAPVSLFFLRLLIVYSFVVVVFCLLFVILFVYPVHLIKEDQILRFISSYH